MGVTRGDLGGAHWAGWNSSMDILGRGYREGLSGSQWAGSSGGVTGCLGETYWAGSPELT